MGEKSAIEWTQNTWNPWQGCRKVSPGCKFCYMYRDKIRYGQDPTIVVRSSPATFNAPLKWKEPALVFTCSWSDWFVEEADSWRDEAWDIIRRTPHLTYQVLTKRPERIANHLPADWGDGYPNVWLGTSVESQKYGMERIPLLQKIPAAVRFLSCEPLLGPVNLSRCTKPTDDDWEMVNDLEASLDEDEPEEFIPENEEECDWINYGNDLVESSAHKEWRSWREERAGYFALKHDIDWVITGGESGAKDKIRPANLDWFRSIRDQCQSAGIAYFHKQHGGSNKVNGIWGGRELDGRTHDDMPETLVMAESSR
jgi:protein gp37